MDSLLKTDIQRLSAKRKSVSALDSPVYPDPIQSTSSISTLSAVTSDSGISSPLTEIPSSRTYHPATVYLTSTNGLFVFSAIAIETLNFKDSMGRDVSIELEA